MSESKSACAIGHGAVAPSGTWAIGDGVDAGRRDQPGVLYVGGDRAIAIGRQVLGRDCNLQEVLIDWLQRNARMDPYWQGP